MTDAIDTGKSAAETASDGVRGPARQNPGAMLRAQREAAGITQATVAQALHLTVHYVKALENDEYAKLPGLTFVKGYFKSYARHLRLDVDEVLASFERNLQQQGALVTQQEQNFRSRKRNDQVVLWAVVASLILVIALGAGWWFFGRTPDAASTSPLRATTVRLPAADTPVNQVQIAPTSPGISVNQPDDATVRIVESQGIPEQSTGTVTGNMETIAEAARGDAVDGSVEVQLDDQIETTPVEPTESGRDVQQGTDSAPDTNTTDEVPVTEDAATDSLMNPDGSRVVELLSPGADLLALQFIGPSWIELENSDQVRLYSALMREGDELRVQGSAPFHLLLGDATQVEIYFNSQLVDINPGIRTDNTARLVIEDTGTTRWVVR